MNRADDSSAPDTKAKPDAEQPPETPKYAPNPGPQEPGPEEPGPQEPGPSPEQEPGAASGETPVKVGDPVADPPKKTPDTKPDDAVDPGFRGGAIKPIRTNVGRQKPGAKNPKSAEKPKVIVNPARPRPRPLPPKPDK